MRIATLVPAATDLVAALGLAGDIVAKSDECDHPLVAEASVVTSSRIPAAGVGGDAAAVDVDTAVSATIAAGDALYEVDLAALHELEVDVVVSQTICDVCAVRRDHFADDLPDHVTVIDVTATSLDGLRSDIEALASALDVPGRSAPLIASLDARIAMVRQRVAGRTRPHVVTIEWTDPPFLGGHWVPEMVELAGGTHLLASEGAPSRRCTWDDVVAAEPAIVVVLPCGYDLDGSVAEAERLVADELFDPATAVWAIDANALTSRCTTAFATAVEVFGAIVSGDDVDPRVATCVSRAP